MNWEECEKFNMVEKRAPDKELAKSLLKIAIARFLTPKIGVNKALISSIAVFLIIGSIWLFINNKYRII